MKTLSFFLALLRTSIRSSVSKRGAFLIELGLMMANNLLFLVLWWLFFRAFDNVNGWGFDEMRLLMAIGLGSYGLMQICFGGLRNLSKVIVQGDLDLFMTQPKPILLHIAGSKSHSKGWGHLLTTLLLLLCGGIVQPLTLLLVAVGILSGTLVFASINAIAHSLPFFLGSVEGVCKKYCDVLFLFTLYPTNIYSGILQVVMFTLIPAGIISYLPTQLVAHFSWKQLFGLVFATSAFVTSALLFFKSGLKRYESGNRFGIRL